MHEQVRRRGFQVEFWTRGRKRGQSMWGIPWSAEDPKEESGAMRGVHPDGGRYRGIRLVADVLNRPASTPKEHQP